MPNLLDDNLIRAASPSGNAALTLPQTLHLMMQDAVTGFPSLRPHQEHAWHAFLTQLSVIAVTENPSATLPESPQAWREALSRLTRDPSAWELIQPDFSRPAFMQPPISGPRQTGKHCTTPDQIDMLFASKNFETKQNIIWEAQPDHWIYALITAQTMSAYGGAGHPAVSRMNGGYSSRTALSLAPQGGPGAHLRRDIQQLIKNPNRTEHNGPALLWTLPWAGTKSESLDPIGLHPLYIEVCRRIRLATNNRRRIEALKFTAAAPRVDAKSKHGATGDPWTPLNHAKNSIKALHLSSEGFTPKLITDILLNREAWQPPPLLMPSPQEAREGPMTLIARAASGGKCETNGYHSVQETINPPLLRAILAPEKAKEALSIADERRSQIRTVRNCLSQAIETRMSGAENQGQKESYKTAARSAAAVLEQAAHATFLHDLQQELAAAGEAAQEVRQEWLHGAEGLIPKARNILAGAPAKHPAAKTQSALEFEHRLNSQPNIPAGPPGAAQIPQLPPPDDRPPAKPGQEAALAPALSETLARAAAQNPLILGRLRRMDPDNPQCPDFDALTTSLGNSYNPEQRARWALIVQGMAMATDVNLENALFRQAHRDGAALGRIAAGAGSSVNNRSFLPPEQARAMLTGQEDVMRRHLKPLLRRLGAAAVRIDWAEAAQLILQPEDAGIKRKILDDYQRAYRARN